MTKMPARTSKADGFAGYVHEFVLKKVEKKHLIYFDLPRMETSALIQIAGKWYLTNSDFAKRIDSIHAWFLDVQRRYCAPK